MEHLLALVLAAQDAPVEVAPGASQPHMAIDAQGNVYAVFYHDGAIQISISTDQGRTFPPPSVAVTGKRRLSGGMQRGPRIAVDGKKTIYVTAPMCLNEAEFSKQYPTQELYLVASTDGGKTFSKPVQVNDDPGGAAESFNCVLAAPNGDVYVAWLDFRGQKCLTYSKVTDQGKKVGRNVIVAPGPLCECCAPGMALDGKGKPTFVYREGNKGQSKPNRGIFVVSATGQGGQVNRGPTGVDG